MAIIQYPCQDSEIDFALQLKSSRPSHINGPFELLSDTTQALDLSHMQWITTDIFPYLVLSHTTFDVWDVLFPLSVREPGTILSLPTRSRLMS